MISVASLALPRSDGSLERYTLSGAAAWPARADPLRTRSVVHLADIFRLADQAGLLRDSDLAVARMRLVLSISGV